MIDVELKNVTLPSHWAHMSRRGRHIARVGGLNMRPALKCGTGAATRVGRMSPDRRKVGRIMFDYDALV